MKIHVPTETGLLCGSRAFSAHMNADKVCSACIKKLERVLAILTDEQLAKLGLHRAQAPQEPSSK